MVRFRYKPLVALVVGSLLVAAAVTVAHAQGGFSLSPRAVPGAEAGEQELVAWRLARQREMIEAREKAEKILEKKPDSYVAHLTLGFVHHYGEGNFPKALYHHERALKLYEREHGRRPSREAPWRWHARMLRELAATHGDLEHYTKRLEFIRRHNQRYEPKMLAERAWPLMKLGRYDEARLAAREGLASDDPRQEEVALNALCAIEFEAGRDRKSYEACNRAVEHSRQTGNVKAVDLTNFAEASRSLFKLDEAERVLLEATEAGVAWYGNPWRALAALYTREGRFAEALDALKQVPKYQAKRPPHVRDSDRNESRRTLAAFFLAVGRAQDAIRITDKALVRPDRRSHNSRDPAQDRAIVALIDRRARRLAASKKMERAAAEPFYEWIVSWAEASWLRFEGWRSGRRAARLLADDERLVGTFRIGTSDSAIMPPWLAGELVEVTGPGIVGAALERARANENREGAGAYYDAFDAEAALARGDEARAVELAQGALSSLGQAEAMLRARVHALAAEAQRRRGKLQAAAEHYDAAFQSDPGVLRRLELELPVHVEDSGSEVSAEVADILEDSPRLEIGEHGFAVRIEADASGGRACLLGVGQAVLGCGKASPKSGDDAEALAGRIASAFHDRVFAPRIDLSQADANSLDGSNRISRDPLETLFDGREEQPPE